MNIFRAVLAVWNVTFWNFVAWSGGPTHHSYTHARWRAWQEGQIVRNFIQG